MEHILLTVTKKKKKNLEISLGKGSVQNLEKWKQNKKERKKRKPWKF